MWLFETWPKNWDFKIQFFPSGIVRFLWIISRKPAGLYQSWNRPVKRGGPACQRPCRRRTRRRLMWPHERSSASPEPRLCHRASSFLPSAPPQSLVTTWLIIPHLLGYLLFSPELIRRIMLGNVELCEAPVTTSGEVAEDAPLSEQEAETAGAETAAPTRLPGTSLLAGLRHQPPCPNDSPAPRLKKALTVS